MLDQRKTIIDNELMLRASAVLATASYCTYGAATPKTIDTGGGFTEGELVVNLTAVDTNFSTVASGQCIDFVIRGSNRSSFDSGYVPLGRLRMGCVFAAESIKAAGVGGSSSGTPTTGMYRLPFNNRYGDTIYRYLRVRVLFGGTFVTGETFSAWMTKR